MSEPEGTITHQNIYQFDASLVSSLPPEIVTSSCDAEPGKSVDHHEQGPEASQSQVVQAYSHQFAQW